MEKSNKKLKHAKSINYKKYINNNLMNIAEYSKTMDRICKEFEKNKEIHEFEEKIFDIFEDIKTVTNEYCDKIKQISKQLNTNQEQNVGVVQKIISRILKKSSDVIDSSIKVFEENKRNPNINLYEDYNLKLDSFNKDYSQKIENMESIRKSYKEEVVQYEAYLVNKELGLLESINNEYNKKKKKDKNVLIDNHLKVFEQQENYLATKEDIENKIKEIFRYINDSRKTMFSSLKHNTELFISSVNICSKELKNMISKVDQFYSNNPINEKEDLINEDNFINEIVKDDLYEFKFLLDKTNIGKEENSEEQKSKKKKKDKKDYLNVDSLLDKLEDENLMKLLKELDTNKIKCNHNNDQKITSLKYKKKIEKYLNLIINQPEKLNDNYKNELKSLLEQSTDNQTSFMQCLNNYRAKGSFELKKLTIIILCDLFISMVEMAVKNNDYKIIQFALILSLTYYHLKEESIEDNIKINNLINEEKKIYMTVYLKKAKPYHSKEFWMNYLQALIHDEIDKLIKRKEKIITDKQRSVAVFSSSFTLIKNMLDYDLDFDFINQVLEEICIQNKFKDTEKQDIVNFLISENQQRPSAKNENKK